MNDFKIVQSTTPNDPKSGDEPETTKHEHSLDTLEDAKRWYYHLDGLIEHLQEEYQDEYILVDLAPPNKTKFLEECQDALDELRANIKEKFGVDVY